MKFVPFFKAKREKFKRSSRYIPSKDGWMLHLIKYEPETKSIKYPILLVHGFGQNRFTWEEPASPFASYLAERGVEVWVLELRGSGKSKKKNMKYDWTFDDFLQKDLPSAIEHIRRENGGRKVFACGHSMGGTLLYVYAAIRGADLKGFISLGGPVIYGLGTISMKYGGIYASVPEIFGFKPAVEYLPFFPLPAAGYIALAGYPLISSPAEDLVPLHPWHWKNVSATRLYPRILLGFEKVSRKLASQLVMWISREGLFSYDQKVNYLRFLPKIKVPFLLVVGDKDRLAPLESIKPVFDEAQSKDKTLIVLKPPEHKTHWGHLDLTMGKHVEDVLLPMLLEWMKKRA